MNELTSQGINNWEIGYVR